MNDNDPCRVCGKKTAARSLLAYGGRCEKCFADAADKIDKMDQERKAMTDNSPHKPEGVSVRRAGMTPGLRADGGGWFITHSWELT